VSKTKLKQKPRFAPTPEGFGKLVGELAETVKLSKTLTGYTPSEHLRSRLVVFRLRAEQITEYVIDSTGEREFSPGLFQQVIIDGVVVLDETRNTIKGFLENSAQILEERFSKISASEEVRVEVGRQIDALRRVTRGASPLEHKIRTCNHVTAFVNGKIREAETAAAEKARLDRLRDGQNKAREISGLIGSLSF
jgi:hypothetical protein